MGNVVGLFDNSSSLTPIADYRFDAFGNQLQTAESAVHNPFRYRGHGYFDEHTGFIYQRFRFYDPSIGRFITEDPYWGVHNMIFGSNGNNGIPNIGAIMQSSNLYAFVTNNPVDFIDFWGLCRDHGAPLSESDQRFSQLVQNALTDLSRSWWWAHYWGDTDMMTRIAALGQEVRRIGEMELRGQAAGRPPLNLGNNTIRVLSMGDGLVQFGIYGAVGLQAQNYTEAMFGDPYISGCEGDAYRHIVWAALMTTRMGEDRARFWLDAHEFGSPSNLATRSAYLLTAMDIHNNDIGQRIGVQNNPQDSADIREAAVRAITSGEAVRVSGGRLVRTQMMIRDF